MQDTLYASDPEARTISGMIKSLQIFASHEDVGIWKKFLLSTGHDVIFSNTKMGLHTEDGQRLVALGWHWDEEHMCWGFFV